VPAGQLAQHLRCPGSAGTSPRGRVRGRPHVYLGSQPGAFFFFKQKTAYEIAEQTAWVPPDVIVAPVAVGETFIAMLRGFREMREAGWIPRVPRMVAAQATRANAITQAFREGTAITPLKIGYTVADGLAAGNPRQKGDWVLRLLREEKGLAGDAEDEEILDAQRRLARTDGVWAGPTGVATLGVLIRLP